MDLRVSRCRWTCALLLGLERVRIDPGNTRVTPFDFVSYRWTHSLVMGVVWAIVLGGLYLWRSRDRTGAIVIAAGVVSHWVLDAVSHRPDLPLAPGDATKVGLGLWASMPATLAVEGALFAAGVALYVRATEAMDRIGRWGLVAYVALLLVAYLSALFGPPPPSEHVLAITGLFMAPLFVPWAAWIDRHRSMR